MKKVNIIKELDLNALNYAISSYEVENDAEYLIMNKQTCDGIAMEYFIPTAACIKGAIRYRGIPIAIDNSLNYGEVNIV